MQGAHDQMQHEIEQMQHEVALLKRQQRTAARRQRMVALAAVAACLVVASVQRGGTAQQPDGAAARELTATRLTIVGADGKARMELGSDDDGGRVYLLNTRGERVVLISADKDGGYLSVRDAQNKSAAILAIGDSGGLMNVYSKDDKPVVVLTATKDGSGTVETNAADAKLQVRLGTDADGGRLWLLDKAEKVQASYPPRAADPGARALSPTVFGSRRRA